MGCVCASLGWKLRCCALRLHHTYTYAHLNNHRQCMCCCAMQCALYGLGMSDAHPPKWKLTDCSYLVIYCLFIHSVRGFKFTLYSWKAQYLAVPAVCCLNLVVYENAQFYCSSIYIVLEIIAVIIQQSNANFYISLIGR